MASALIVPSASPIRTSNPSSTPRKQRPRRRRVRHRRNRPRRGIINIVPVSKKQFEGAEPWVPITGFRVKIDGCVGGSFIRSYAFLTRSTDVSDAILGYHGVTKKV
jgi:MspA